MDSGRCSSRGVKPPSWSPGGDGGRKLAGEEPIDRSPTTKVARSVAEALADHTTLTLECIDRMYLNVYVPLLQSAAGAAYFFRKMRGAAVPSSALMAPMTQRFVDAIKSFAARNRIEIVSFRRGERKDDRTRQYLRRWSGGEGVLYIGKAQERAKVVRTERRHDPATGDTYPWLAASTAMVNQFYFYAVDDDFGPFFLKSRLRNSWGWRLGAVLNSPGKHPFALDRRLDAGSGGPAARREVEVGLFRRVADQASEHRWVTDAGRAPRGVAGGALVMSPGVRAGRR